MGSFSSTGSSGFSSFFKPFCCWSVRARFFGGVPSAATATAIATAAVSSSSFWFNLLCDLGVLLLLLISVGMTHVYNPQDFPFVEEVGGTRIGMRRRLCLSKSSEFST